MDHSPRIFPIFLWVYSWFSHWKWWFQAFSSRLPKRFARKTEDNSLEDIVLSRHLAPRQGHGGARAGVRGVRGVGQGQRRCLRRHGKVVMICGLWGGSDDRYTAYTDYTNYTTIVYYSCGFYGRYITIEYYSWVALSLSFGQEKHDLTNSSGKGALCIYIYIW